MYLKVIKNEEEIRLKIKEDQIENIYFLRIILEALTLIFRNPSFNFCLLDSEISIGFLNTFALLLKNQENMKRLTDNNKDCHKKLN